MTQADVSVLESDRLELCRPGLADREEFLAAVAGSRTLHHPWVAPPPTDGAFALYLERVASDDQFGFLTRRRSDRTLVGVVNINNVVLGAFQSGYLGYYGFAGGVGRGLMAEAVGLVVTHAFASVGLHRLEANIQPGNEPSLRLVRRLGFRHEGFSPDYLFIDGAWRDHERWAITSDLWRP